MDDPKIVRFWAVALIPVAGLAAWYLLFGLDSYSYAGILAPVGVAVVASFLANAIWPVCVRWRSALFLAVPPSFVHTCALAAGVPHPEFNLACGRVVIFFLIMGILVGLFGFLGAHLGHLVRTKVIPPPLAAAATPPSVRKQFTPQRKRWLGLAAAGGIILLLAVWLLGYPIWQKKQTQAALAAGPVFIPSGEFLMGTVSGFGEEEPQHTVYLNAYWIDRVEVTNGMYARCVAANACEPPRSYFSTARNPYYGDPQYDQYPVVNVSWEDAAAYCQWAGGRLPTEAEWEKAARGTDGRRFPWGNSEPKMWRLNLVGMYGTTPVGAYPAGASPYGVLDMAGNVSEWAADWYDPKHYAVLPARNPTGPTTGKERAVRGSNWGHWEYIHTVYDVTVRRGGFPTGGGDTDLGFRCTYSE